MKVVCRKVVVGGGRGWRIEMVEETLLWNLTTGKRPKVNKGQPKSKFKIEHV